MRNRPYRRVVGLWRRHPSFHGTPKDGAVTVSHGRRYQYDAHRNAWRIVRDWQVPRAKVAAIAVAAVAVAETVRVVFW